MEREMRWNACVALLAVLVTGGMDALCVASVCAGLACFWSC